MDRVTRATPQRAAQQSEAPAGAGAPAGIEERIRRLEDLEAIRDITARYAYAVSKGYAGRQVDYEALRSVFASDAVWHSDFMKLHQEGLDNILASLQEETAPVEISAHAFVNPVIDLDGDAAAGHWMMPVGSFHGGRTRAVFMAADFGYQRTPEGWRIAAADVSFAVMLAV